MTSNDNEDPTIPSGSLPGGEQGPEDRTVPSQAGPSGDGAGPTGGAMGAEEGAGAGEGAGPEESTVPALNAEAAGASTGELIGKALGGCRIDRLLGRGAMGAVYKARQLKLDRDVAVKIIRPEMMTDPRMLKRFEVEARTVGKFNSANVVMVHDVGFELGVHYLVMEFVQGKNLREHVKLLPNGRLPAGDALPLIRQACKGLEEARRLEVVHRDIKPDNLMLTDQEVLKIADFGIAKPVQDDFSMTLTSELIGTPLYMSPEQCQGGANIDFRSDMYSLGATFFYLLTGEPPIRASSVYELIQTKTKLENLCLWKSLPELDENHPLSRVIERMTANDRDDRYESYEELLNDLVLVEAGETISARIKKPKKPASATRAGGRTAGGEGGGGNGKWVAIVAGVLLAGGGGYWWSQRDLGKASGGNEVVDGGGKVDSGDPQTGAGDPGSVGGTQPADDGSAAALAAAKEALRGFTKSLREQGPGDELLASIRTAKVPAAQASATLGKSFERLEQDVLLAQGVEKALAELSAPTKPQPPFDDLAAYLAAVDAACTLPGSEGPEMRQWVAARRVAGRDEANLGSAAIMELRASFQDWRDRREQVVGDEAALAKLGAELTRIGDGRDRLLGIFPKRRDDLNEGVARAQLDKARLGLRSPVVRGDADVAERVAEIRAEFLESGPAPALILSCEKLQPTSPGDLKLRDDLVNELRKAQNIKRTADNSNQLYPTKPTAPEFDDVEAFFAAIDRPLRDLATGEQMPAWAKSLRKRLRREADLERAVQRSCEDLWQQWQAAERSQAAVRLLSRDAADVRRAVARAGELFPSLSGPLAASVPLDQLKSRLDAAKVTEQRLAWQGQLANANRRLGTVMNLGAWQAAEIEMGQAAAALRASLQALGGDAALARQLAAFDAGCEKWRGAQATLAKACGQFAAGQLSDCVRAINVASVASEGRAEFAELKAIVTACQDAFDGLQRTLNIQEATSKLDQASRVLAASTSLPGTVAVQIKAWQDSFVKLQNASSGMVPIEAAGNVGAFFLSATECSRREFASFQRQLRAAVEAGGGAEVPPRLAGVPVTAAQLKELIEFRLTGGDELPAERVRWFEALAFCKWSGKDLPTEAEWMLAAFGEGRRYKYSWGNDWSNAKPQRNPNRNRACDVTDGGLSWRSTSGKQLHHLSGNVAEWLAGASGGRGQVAGGRYSRGMGATAKEYASGKIDTVGVSERRSGIGFRAVLRPRDFSELSWPQ